MYGESPNGDQVAKFRRLEEQCGCRSAKALVLVSLWFAAMGVPC